MQQRICPLALSARLAGRTVPVMPRECADAGAAVHAEIDRRNAPSDDDRSGGL